MKDRADEHMERMSNALNWLRSAPPKDELVDALVLICLRDNAKDYPNGCVPEKHLEKLVREIDHMMAQVGLLSLFSKGMAKVCLKLNPIRFGITQAGRNALEGGEA